MMVANDRILMFRKADWVPLILVLLFCAGVCGGGTVSAQEVSESRSQLAGEVDLARVLDLCAELLGLQIEFDPASLRHRVALRNADDLSTEDLWQIANRLLAARNLTTVRMAGSEMLSVVSLQEASAKARVETSDTIGRPEVISPGFVTLRVEAAHVPAPEIVSALSPLATKPHGSVRAIGNGGMVLMSDLEPSVRSLLAMFERLDVPVQRPIIDVIELRHRSASDVSVLITSATTTRNAIMPTATQGKVTAMDGDSTLLLVAPPRERAYWTDLIAQFDTPVAVDTRSYTISQFAPGDVRSLIEETARDTSPRGAGGDWRMVEDKLTGSMIITATGHEHERIDALLERLDAIPAALRRSMRSFEIRNRTVGEVVDVVTALIDAGVLDATAQSDRRREVTSGVVGLERSSRAIDEMSNRSPGEDGSQTTTGRAGRSVGPSEQPNRLSSSELTLTSDESTNTLIAIGDARLVNQLEQLIETLDVRQPQVMLEVLLIALTEGQTLDLGVQLEKLELSGGTVISLSSLFGLGATSGISTLPSPGTGFTGVALNPGDFSVVLRALETINEGRSLNIPKVLVNNNQTATLDSVLQEPFLSTNASDTVATTSFSGTQDAGTQITVTPQIAAGDFLNLDYTVTLSAFVGDSNDPALPPPRQQNTLNSSATIPDGFTIVVGGLEVVNETEAVSQVPLLGSLPWLGEAFKKRSRTESISRFYVFIRPTVLRHDGFEDLRYLSEADVHTARIDDGWPRVEPRLIR